MAMDLRRRNKQHVMETMDGKTPAPRAHEFACAHGDEPLIQRVGAYCLASGYSSDCRLDFDDGGRREEKRVLVGLNPVSKAVRSPLGRARESIARSWALARVAAALDTAHQKMRRRLCHVAGATSAKCQRLSGCQAAATAVSHVVIAAA